MKKNDHCYKCYTKIEGRRFNTRDGDVCAPCTFPNIYPRPQTKKCPVCGNNFSLATENSHSAFGKVATKMAQILSNKQSPYQKKLALLECLKKLPVGELTKEESKRINFLMQSRLYAELAKQSMNEYKKLTVQDYSKKK